MTTQKSDVLPEETPAASGVPAIDIAVRSPADRVVVVTVTGEVDMITAPELRACLRQNVDGRRAVVLDLSGVSFLASAGLAVLIEALRHSQRCGADLRLVVTSRAVRRPLQATGLGEVFALHETVAEALREVGAQDN
jgi:anti-anti-sigma factor